MINNTIYIWNRVFKKRKATASYEDKILAEMHCSQRGLGCSRVLYYHIILMQTWLYTVCTQLKPLVLTLHSVFVWFESERENIWYWSNLISTLLWMLPCLILVGVALYKATWGCFVVKSTVWDETWLICECTKQMKKKIYIYRQCKIILPLIYGFTFLSACLMSLFQGLKQND